MNNAAAISALVLPLAGQAQHVQFALGQPEGEVAGTPSSTGSQAVLTSMRAQAAQILNHPHQRHRLHRQTRRRGQHRRGGLGLARPSRRRRACPPPAATRTRSPPRYPPGARAPAAGPGSRRLVRLPRPQRHLRDTLPRLAGCFETGAELDLVQPLRGQGRVHRNQRRAVLLRPEVGGETRNQGHLPPGTGGRLTSKLTAGGGTAA